ncbi:AAA family ATPase [Streptomyces globisporus]|uniref:AAA family ATPase n=1 Tax=Streptomyces globisporus TaxID=1908 RepID=UPI00369B59CE
MIIWLNGPFGVGKSTLATDLHRALKGSAVADPERVGVLLRSALNGHELAQRDYQDYPPWRQVTTTLVTSLAAYTGGPVIVPMTVLDPHHATDLLTPLRQTGRPVHHLVLHAAPDVLEQRITTSHEFPGDPVRSAAVRAYRHRRAADYQKAADSWMHTQGHVIDTAFEALSSHIDERSYSAASRRLALRVLRLALAARCAAGGGPIDDRLIKALPGSRPIVTAALDRAGLLAKRAAGTYVSESAECRRARTRAPISCTGCQAWGRGYGGLCRGVPQLGGSVSPRRGLCALRRGSCAVAGGLVLRLSAPPRLPRPRIRPRSLAATAFHRGHVGLARHADQPPPSRGQARQ